MRLRTDLWGDRLTVRLLAVVALVTLASTFALAVIDTQWVQPTRAIGIQWTADGIFMKAAAFGADAFFRPSDMVPESAQ